MLMEYMESLSTSAWISHQCVRQQTPEQECTQQARTMDKYDSSINCNIIRRGDGWPGDGIIIRRSNHTFNDFILHTLIGLALSVYRHEQR